MLLFIIIDKVDGCVICVHILAYTEGKCTITPILECLEMENDEPGNEFNIN